MEKQTILSEKRAPWPYAHGVIMRDGDIMICAGQVAFSKDREIVCKGDMQGQCRQAFENVKRVLGEAGASMGDILHLTVYVTEMKGFPKLGPIAKEYLHEPFPAMTLIGVKELAWPDLMIEIQATVGMRRKG